MLWQHRGVKEATWEHEDTMRTAYPFLFKDEGMFFSYLVAFNDCCIYIYIYDCIWL